MITILGPTATGKTTIASHLAARIDAEIISADSRQVYRGMNLGSGKDLDEYFVNGKQIPYHLIDIAEPGYEYNVYEFQRDFRGAYEDISYRGKTCILCGGSGLYLESVLLGYDLLKVPENPALRAKFEDASEDELIKLLRSKGHLHNTSDITERDRMIRAIEIRAYYEENPARIKNHFPAVPSRVFGIYFERSLLRERITKRLEARLSSGMLDEVKELLESGLQPGQLTYYGLEYKYLTEHLSGKISYEQMLARLNTAIHQFAKRQMTWFRRMQKRGINIQWVNGLKPLEEKIRYILARIPE
ncbi:MAG: tRNA (adenosine(37)-N6)-dimethylallyltransferase MiaA [Bacteroidota bacterium]|nr:tRNA (adenosine(37)-N6)-dimethylallyltransferase MiaA [Bacteroidota bacterium]